MSAPAGLPEAPNYFSRFGTLVWRSSAQLVRAPSHSRRAEAARRSARHLLLLTAMIGAAIIALMYVGDVPEISMMPPRGTPSLWPLRILTDFGKDANVLWALAGLMVAVALLAPALRGLQRQLLLGLGTRLQFLFFAVLFPVLIGELLKWAVGRGRPFVGGHANAFNFSHFAGTEAFASFPSGHATTAFALAFAVSALWPRAWPVMAVYALLIGATRLVLLAHHPSDVVAGALVGIIGAMAVRYWFAARRLAFAIRHDGTIAPLTGPSQDRLKRVARGAFAP
jgi:membrane-associated phospholipid phosphatase